VPKQLEFVTPGATPQAGLNLTNDALTKNYKALFYKRDEQGCRHGLRAPNTGKLIDSANPMNSMMYTKAISGRLCADAPLWR